MAIHPPRFGIASGQQNYRWAELRRLWEAADRAGYDSLWTGDHLLAIASDPANPAFEGWTTLAALSQHTARARIGSLVNCNGFRNPCLTAKMAMTIDHECGGRFILGLGAGWFEQEHLRLGFEFKPAPQRLRALDESCRIIKGMLEQGTATFRGRHYVVSGALCSPRPVQRPRPPLMIAGQGEKVLLRIVAEHADMWNAQGSPERMRRMIEVIRAHGEKVKRDADQIEKTVAMFLCYRRGEEREREAIAAAAAFARIPPEQARMQMMIGERQECLDRVGSYLRAGVTHFLFISVRQFDIDEIRRFAQEVIPPARSIQA